MKKLLIILSIGLLASCQTRQTEVPVKLSYTGNKPLVYKTDTGFLLLNAFMHENAQTKINIRLDELNDSGEYRIFHDRTDEEECKNAGLQKVYFYKGRYLPKNTGYPVLYGGADSMKSGPMFTEHRDFTFMYKAQPDAKPKLIKAYSTNIRDQWYRQKEYDSNSPSSHVSAVPAVIIREAFGFIFKPILILTGG